MFTLVLGPHEGIWKMGNEPISRYLTATETNHWKHVPSCSSKPQLSHAGDRCSAESFVPAEIVEVFRVPVATTGLDASFAALTLKRH